MWQYQSYVDLLLPGRSPFLSLILKHSLVNKFISDAHTNHFICIYDLCGDCTL